MSPAKSKANAESPQSRLFRLVDEVVGGIKMKRLSGPSAKATNRSRAFSGTALSDPRTGAIVTHGVLSLAQFSKIADIRENFYQRKLQNHLTDPVYKKLIISILKGHLIPEIRLGVLNGEKKLNELEWDDFLEGKYKVSIIDGLQRYCCFLIALLLVVRKDQLIEEKLLNAEAYHEFEPYLKNREPLDILGSVIRVEIYYNIEQLDLLQYMIIFNTAQKRMSLQHQLEIMENKILANLKSKHKVRFALDRDPGKRTAGDFKGAELIYAMRAYISRDHTVSMAKATEELFWSTNDEKDDSMDEKRLEEASLLLSAVTNQLHPLVQKFYSDSDDPKMGNILCGSVSLFLVPMMASLRKCADRKKDPKAAIAGLNRMIRLYRDGVDVFKLEEYYALSASIKSSRGVTLKKYCRTRLSRLLAKP